MMIQARVIDDYTFGGDDIAIAIRVTNSEDGQTQRFGRLQTGEDGRTWMIWETVDEMAVARQPTLRLNNEVARALLDALMRFYEGASDMKLVRQDLLHERGRVDKLLDTISSIAAATPMITSQIAQK